MFTIAPRHLSLTRIAPIILLVAIGEVLSKPQRLAADDSPPTLEAIYSNWQSRSDEIRTASFYIDETYTTFAGTQSADGKTGIFPTKDEVRQHKIEIHFDDLGSVRYSRQGEYWIEIVGKFCQTTHTQVYDGRTGVGKAYWDTEDFPSDFPRGAVGKTFGGTGTYLNAAPLIFARALHTRIHGYDLRTWILPQPSDELAAPNSLERRRNDDNMLVGRLVLDPSNRFAPLTIESLGSGKLFARLEIEYRHDPSHGKVPGAWTMVKMLGGNRQELLVQARVTKCELNAPQAADLYDIEFPAGTRVQEEDEQGNPTLYVIGEDGGRVELQHAIETELLRGDSGATIHVIVLLGAAVLLLGVVVYWRLWRSRG